MGRIRIAFITGRAALAALTAGCQATVNTNNTNAAVTANANVYSNANVYPNANANAGANANSNANANASGGAIDVSISREDFDRQKERFEREAREAGRKVGPGASDLWIWTKARAALASAQDLRDSTVSVDVDNSVVTLTGTVASNEQKARAGEVAKVVGATRVVNNLTVSAGGGSNANRNANTK